MAYPAYLRERARELRTTKALTLDEIAERLALPKTTVYYWIRDLPLGRPRRASPGQRKGNTAMRAKYQRLREDAYEQGRVEYDEFVLLPTFRDFVVLYIAEGYKRSRNMTSICNSDPTIVAMAAKWTERLSGRAPIVRVQYHEDQDVSALGDFWGTKLGVDPVSIRFKRSRTAGL
jgi:AcrR family transcriptional regulator